MINLANKRPVWLYVSSYVTMLQQKVEAVKEEIVRFYPDPTVQEWLEEHVWPVQAPLQRIVDEIAACIKEMVPSH